MLSFFRYHARMLLAVALGALVFALAPIESLVIREAVAWNAGVLFFLIHVGYSMIRCGDAHDLRERARKLDVKGYVLFTLMILAAFGSLYLSLSLQDAAKSAEGWMRPLGFGLALGTVVLSWLFVQVMFGVHYAHHYYAHDTKGGNDPGDSADARDDDEGGLEFPKGNKNEEPDFIDFLYFSFVLGMTFQVSDVKVTRHHMRHLALAHGVIAFFFNTFILALSVNIAAGVFDVK